MTQEKGPVDHQIFELKMVNPEILIPMECYRFHVFCSDERVYQGFESLSGLHQRRYSALRRISLEKPKR